MKPKDTVPLPTNDIKYPAFINNPNELYVCWWALQEEHRGWIFESVVFTDKDEGYEFYKNLVRLTLP